MYSRSYVGPRARKLFEAKRLQDLWSLLYNEEPPLVPEGLLALLLERKTEEQMVQDYITLLSAYDTPDPLSLSFLSLYDYNNLKSASAQAALGKPERPFMIDTSPFSLFDTDAWPDIGAMTQASPVSWYNRVPSGDDQIDWETKLDHEYYHTLWKSFSSLGKKDRQSVEDLVTDEIILQNIVWALRLKVYYQKSPEEIFPQLACYDEQAPVSDVLCQAAMEAASKPIDDWNAWAGWKYSWLCNHHDEGAPWTIDPRWAQLSADRYLFKKALSKFHQAPFTVGVLVSFFKIKQLEEQMIRVAAEGLRLGATDSQMNDFMGDGRDA